MKGYGNNGHGRLAGAVLRCQSDSRLVGLAREGHERAFEEIVRRYRVPLVTYAAGIVPDHHAEDVVQEAITKAHAALARSDAEINLRPWLFTIVRNGALNALRGEPSHVHLDENYDGVPQPPEVATRREELAALMASVKSLPDPQRQAIVKRELEGRSHEEIASSLGITAGAVRGLIYRARATLRNGLGLLIPMPVLRTLLASGSATPEATGAAGAAAGLAAGGGGVALKAGATLGVAVLAVGSGFAIQHQGGKPAEQSAAAHGHVHSSRVLGGDGSSAARMSGASVGRELLAQRQSGSSGESGGGHGHQGSSSGPGPGSRSGSGSSGEEPGGSGTTTGGGSGSGSGSSSDDGGGSGTSGSGDGGGGTDTSGSGDGGDSTTDGGGSSGSGGDGSSGSSDDGGGDVTTTTTTTTTTPTDGGDGGSSVGGD